MRKIFAVTEKERTVTGMAEYIEREAAIESIMSEPPDAHYPHWYAEKIKAIPAADVAPVRWQPVFGYEGLYEVNQFGQIRNKDGQIMRQRLKKAKYTVYRKSAFTRMVNISTCMFIGLLLKRSFQTRKVLT